MALDTPRNKFLKKSSSISSYIVREWLSQARLIIKLLVKASSMSWNSPFESTSELIKDKGILR